MGAIREARLAGTAAASTPTTVNKSGTAAWVVASPFNNELLHPSVKELLDLFFELVFVHHACVRLGDVSSSVYQKSHR